MIKEYTNKERIKIFEEEIERAEKKIELEELKVSCLQNNIRELKEKELKDGLE